MLSMRKSKAFSMFTILAVEIRPKAALLQDSMSRVAGGAEVPVL